MHAVAWVRKALRPLVERLPLRTKFGPLVTRKTRYVYAKKTKVNATNCAKSSINKYNE